MNNLESQLWKIANDLRGQMDSVEFKNYMLGFIFIKFLSERVEKRANELLIEEGITDYTYVSLPLDHVLCEDIYSELQFEFGYYIKQDELFNCFVKKVKTNDTIIEALSNALANIEKSTQGRDSEDDFIGLFDDMDLENNKLGANAVERNNTLSSIITNINDIEGLTNDVDVLGNAYEYLIKMFASDAGKKGGEFYTPKEVSDVVAKLVTVEKKQVGKVYDPTCGSGSLLLNAVKNLDKYSKICGQELNVTTYNLARMNMFLHGIAYRNFDIKQGDTLRNDKFPDAYGQNAFDVIVANPPFGVNWDAATTLLDEDERFAKYGKLAPKSKGEFAFLQHMVAHLADNGVMASVVPHGVLFRGAAELTIRRYMIEKDNIIDAVIGLPANLFYGTGIPACIIVFKKCRTNDDILFIDASKEFDKIKTQNVLNPDHIEKIITTYKERNEVDKYSRKVSIKEIEENDYNLNIPRYVDTFEEEAPIDIELVRNNIKELKKSIAIKEQEIEEMLKELDL